MREDKKGAASTGLARSQIGRQQKRTEAIRQFVDCVFEPNDTIEIRQLPGTARTWHKAKKLAAQAVELVAANAKGQNIYVGANPRSRKGGSKSADVALARSLFVDFDGIDLAEARRRWHAAGLPEPTLIIHSGHGIHAYWRLNEPLADLARWTSLQKAMISVLGSDPAIHDPPRIMRLPGFKNCKAKPRVPCYIIAAKPSRHYPVFKLSTALKAARPFAKCSPQGGAIAQIESSADLLNRAQAYLACIPGVSEGERNPQAFRAACALVQDFSLADADALRLLKKWNKGENHPPLGDDELRQVLANARQYAKQPAGNKLTGEDRSPATAEQLVRLAQEKYRFARTDKDEPFAAAHNGPNIALMLKGSADSLRAKLAREYRIATGRTPCASALADALTVLTGEAQEAEAEPVYLRLAKDRHRVVIDLADASGGAVVVRPGSWKIVKRSPVLFRRTALTAQLPMPETGGTLAEFRELLNVADADWPLIVGWLVAALVPDIPHPIMLLSGQQGTGKSCAARMLVQLFDPSPVPLRSEPRDAEQWAVAASGSWGVALDNLSHIPPWLSDALCKAVTGDGVVKRALYTDGNLAIFSFRRVVLLTSIDAGALRGDLGERLMLIDLEPISDDERKTEQDLDLLFTECWPRLFGAILDGLAAVLVELPMVKPGRLPRMADFGRVLAAADAAGLTDGAFDRFLGQQGRIAGEVIEGDPFATALVEFIRERDKWQGTATELLAALLPQGTDKSLHGWPKQNNMAGRLKRLIPALRADGVQVEVPLKRTNRGRILRLRLVESASDLSSRSSRDNAGSIATNVGCRDDAIGDADARDDRSSRNDDCSDDSKVRRVAKSLGKNGTHVRSDDSDDPPKRLSNATPAIGRETRQRVLPSVRVAKRRAQEAARRRAK